MGFSVGQYLFETFLTLRQYRVLQNTSRPAILSEVVSQEAFNSSQAYGRANAKFRTFSGLCRLILDLALMQFNGLLKLWSGAGNLLLKWAPARFSGDISQATVFCLTLTVISELRGLPASIYQTFVLEEKFGFNNQTPKLFATDLLKSQIITFILTPLFVTGSLLIVQGVGNQFFYSLWLLFVAYEVFMITIYPVAILPLFDKLLPLEDGELKTKVEALAASLEFPLHKVCFINGCKRSGHSNACFFGLHWNKRIVLYDTLIKKCEIVEVIAVLAHELGHWKLRHTAWDLGVSQVSKCPSAGQTRSKLTFFALSSFLLETPSFFCLRPQ